MARVFITGSSDGLGLLSAQMLVKEGHTVVLHARNKERAGDAKERLPEAEAVLIGDLADIEQTKQLALSVNGLGHFDAVIHNAGITQTAKSTIFIVNTLAPYILTLLIKRPERLIYVGSGMHRQGNFDLANLSLDRGVSYSDSKLLLLMQALAAAHQWPDTFINTVDPGWVPTKMGGKGAPDDLNAGAYTQVWLATGNDATFTGKYLFHQTMASHSSKADDIQLQEQLIKRCEEISGVKWESEY